MKLSPVVLFVYNRPLHTQKTVEALQRNELASDSELYIYSDGPKETEEAQAAVAEVRRYLKGVGGFNKITVVENSKNLGLANSIINGVTEVIEKYGRAIVLEDDLITSPYFITYMNQALQFYESNKQIFSISGFSFSKEFLKIRPDYTLDVYAHVRPMSWGWGTWLSRWEKADWLVEDYNKFINDSSLVSLFNRGGTDLAHMLSLQKNGCIDSWYIRWCYASFENRALNIYPTMSLVNNIGHDASGVHCGVERKNVRSHNELSRIAKYEFSHDIQLDNQIIRNFNKAFNLRIVRRIKILLKSLAWRIKKWLKF